MLYLTRKHYIACSLAFSIGLGLSSAVYAADGTFTAPNGRAVNTIHQGRIINGGNYYSSQNGATTFTNRGQGGLWLKKGSLVRGIQVDSVGNANGHGGNIRLYAPNGVVRVDGDINVSNVNLPGSGFIGNGGNVFIDAAYLYQNGNIYANGFRGGVVQFNVGGATFGALSKVLANGNIGGGEISVNSSGPVNIQKQATFSSSVDPNLSQTSFLAFKGGLVNIEGSLVNIEGKVHANGVTTTGGTVRLVSTGQTSLTRINQALQDATTAGTMTASEANATKTQLTQLQNTYDGDIRITANAQLSANGGHINRGDLAQTGPGGSILITAKRNILNDATLSANGGGGIFVNGPVPGSAGGTIALLAGRNIINNGNTFTNGGAGGSDDALGGSGGLQAFQYANAMLHSGRIESIGGQNSPFTPPGQGAHGGLVVFSGPGNYQLGGSVNVLGGKNINGIPVGPSGVIAIPSPATVVSPVLGILSATTGLELLAHNQNLILLRSNLTQDSTNHPGDLLGDWIQDARVRTVLQPNITVPPMPNFDPAWQELVEKSHVTAISDPAAVNAVIQGRPFAYQDQPFSFRSGELKNLMVGNTTSHRLELGADTGFVKMYNFDTPSGNLQFSTNLDLSRYSSMTLLSKGIVFAQPVFSGGHFSSISSIFRGRVRLFAPNLISGGSVNIAADTNFLGSDDFTSRLQGVLHGGSIIIKAGDYIDTGRGLVTNGDLAGGTIQLFAGKSITNRQFIEANGGIFGGAINALAQRRIYNEPLGTPNHVQANGGRYGGFIRLAANDWVKNTGTIEALGNTANGQVIIRSGQ